MSNIKIAQQIVYQLLASGVQEFCLCAGARNSPFVFLFDKNPHIKIYNFFEERSAAFFALGRYQATGRPAAVVTTSGTAVAELLPAVVEAHYSGWPLVLLTADRPKSYRGTGAPQSIEQVGIFSFYTEKNFDLDNDSFDLNLSEVTWQKPIHINACFKEPLLDEEIPLVPHINSVDSCFFNKISTTKENLNVELNDFLKSQYPAVIVSSLPKDQIDSVRIFLQKLKVPIYAESTSGLRGDPILRPWTIESGELFLNSLIEKKICSAVLRLGGVPTVRLWRDLEDKYNSVPVFSVSQSSFSGLSRQSIHKLGLAQLADIPLLPEAIEHLDYKSEKLISEKYIEKDQHQVELLKLLCSQYPKSEQAIFYFLSLHAKNQNVYLGNSLPIRYWDLAASYDHRPNQTFANRGANGIDGQISTFFGTTQEDIENWGIFGDLTALYDLTAPWILDQISASKVKIVIINNGGGMIFERMFSKEIFLNRHNVEFSSWAQMWKCVYQKWNQVPVAYVPQNVSTEKFCAEIIEIVPDPEQTKIFHKEWVESWKS